MAENQQRENQIQDTDTLQIFNVQRNYINERLIEADDNSVTNEELNDNQIISPLIHSNYIYTISCIVKTLKK